MRKLLAIILAGLLLPVFSVLGAVDYDRSPSGYSIPSPVSFEISWESWESDTGCLVGESYWGVLLTTTGGGTEFLSDFYASTTQATTTEMSLGVGTEVGYVAFSCSENGTTKSNIGSVLEGTDASSTTFVIQPTLFEAPAGAISAILDFITDLFAGLGPFIWLIIGIPLAFVVVNRLTRVMPK